MTVTANAQAFTLSQTTKKLHKIVLPDCPPKKVTHDQISVSFSLLLQVFVKSCSVLDYRYAYGITQIVRVRIQMGAFIKYKIPKLIFLLLFREMFGKDFSYSAEKETYLTLETSKLRSDYAPTNH